MGDGRPILQCSLTAEDVLRGADPGDPRLTVVGVLRNIYAWRFPATHPRLAVFNIWLGVRRASFSEEVKILSPDGSAVVGEARTRFEVAPGMTHHSMSYFRNLEFVGPGDHQVQILLDGEEMIRYPLTIIRIPEPVSTAEEVQS